jgi:hypothetical protein
MGSKKDGLYRDRFTDEERQRLREAGRAGAADSVDEEIELLRVLIRRAMEAPEPDAESVGRLVDRLGSLYRTRRGLGGRADDGLTAGQVARIGHQVLLEGRERAAKETSR